MPTRFYFPSTGAAAVSPAYDAGWEYTFGVARRQTVTAKISSAMATLGNSNGNQVDEDHLIRQYVSDAIEAQTIAAQTVELQIRGYEFYADGNMYSSVGIRVVSNDGTVVRGTILAVTRDDTELVVSTLTNRRFTALTSQVVAQANDRIVIEIGTGGAPVGGADDESYLRIGDASGTDLPEDDTDTNDYNPWLEFPNAITFVGAPAAGVTGAIWI